MSQTLSFQLHLLWESMKISYSKVSLWLIEPDWVYIHPWSNLCRSSGDLIHQLAWAWILCSTFGIESGLSSTWTIKTEKEKEVVCNNKINIWSLSSVPSTGAYKSLEIFYLLFVNEIKIREGLDSFRMGAGHLKDQEVIRGLGLLTLSTPSSGS